jgi:hypothetical protein
VTDALEGLFAVLARHVYGAQLATQPIAVADVVSRWLPYAEVRAAISVPTREEYDVLLMRLLSGEGGYVFADEALQDDLRREVAAQHPDRTALQAYGAARITLARAALQRVLELEDGALPPPPSAAPARPSRPFTSPVPDPTAPAPAPRTAMRAACQYCGGALPSGRTVRYCPHCGLDVLTVRCTGCSAELDASWRYCVACGRAVHQTSS